MTDHHLLPYTVHYDFAPFVDTVPSYLSQRGNWRKLKELTGDGTFKDGTQIKVGVGDTGISRQHVESGDLKGAYAKDFTNSRSGWADKSGHGSHVSCHIGAREDARGTLGIAAKSQIVHAKVLGDNGSGSSAGIIRGVKWLADEGCKIINLSLGGGGYSNSSDRFYKELDEAGILVFAAMGNSGQGGERGGYPGRYSSTIGVTAVDYNKRLASFSSQSKDATMAGYGVRVRSCIASGGYARFSGTSMATPDQAGLAALLVGFFDRHGIVVKNKAHYLDLIATANGFEDLGPPGLDEFFGIGFIDPWKVISYYGIPSDKPKDPKPPTDPTPDPDKVCGQLILEFGEYAIVKTK